MNPIPAWKLLMICHLCGKVKSVIHIDNDTDGELPQCCGLHMTVANAVFVMVQHALLAK